MKKLPALLLCAALVLTLAACGGKKAEGPGPFDPAADSQTLLASGCFSEELTEIPTDIVCATYGIDPETVTAGACYGSTGATAEELTILVLKDEAATQEAMKLLGYRVEDRTEDMKSYLPAEVPKLEKAVTASRGNSVLLAVASDYGPVEKLTQ